jgi:hypothetical protein
MLYHAFKSLVALALGANTVLAQNSANSLVSRRLTEYLMPAATETHEFARVPGSNFVLLTQMPDSELLKIELDLTTEELIAFHSFPMGKNSSSQLHSVWPSTVYPGMMWLSLQGDNQLLLVNPGQELGLYQDAGYVKITVIGEMHVQIVDDIFIFHLMPFWLR